ncbi:MAG: GTPase HflX [Phycisphaeraceae bacterium]|nr:MAG: GTPase HflX [Phycisphaeraceae bacterium]
MPVQHERSELAVQSERAVVAAVRLPDSRFDRVNPFGEIRSLAEQAGANVVGELTQNLTRPFPATYMGPGKVEELKALCEALDAKTIIFDHDLTPKQIGNIEKATLRKVLDRSELILDIFASRATSAEAKLQVELAQLEYTYPRLKAMWSHLERITGGIGSRGPGEQQLEIDRRLVQSRKDDLKRAIAEVQDRKRREVQRRKLEHFTVGVVGYTNAGKSTLFNTLTSGGAYADDRLFATLMTRTREWDLAGGLTVMLSDTVGFVRDLPHNLIAAFRATLEEATHADLLLIVVDVSDPAAQMQLDTVTSTLDGLIGEVAEREARLNQKYTPPPRLLLLNKADRLADNRDLLVWQQRDPSAIPICALDPVRVPEAAHSPYRAGIEAVRRAVLDAARGEVEALDITIPLAESKTVHLVENRAEVVDRRYTDTHVTLAARIGAKVLARLRAGGARFTVASPDGGEVVLPEPDAGPIRPTGWSNAAHA